MLGSLKTVHEEAVTHFGSLASTVGIGGALGAVLAGVSKYYGAAPVVMQRLLLVSGILFVLDNILGIIDSKVNKGKKFSSDRMGKGVVKLAVYLSVYILALCLDLAANTEFSAQILALGVVVSREGKSNLEHLHNLERYTRIKIPKWLGEKYDEMDGDTPPKEEDKPTEGEKGRWTI